MKISWEESAEIHIYGKSQSLMGKHTISVAIFNSYVIHYHRVHVLVKSCVFFAWLQRQASWSQEWSVSSWIFGDINILTWKARAFKSTLRCHQSHGWKPWTSIEIGWNRGFSCENPNSDSFTIIHGYYLSWSISYHYQFIYHCLSTIMNS